MGFSWSSCSSLAFWFLLGQADPAAATADVTPTTIGDAGVLPPPEPPPSAPPVFDWFLVGLVASIAVVLPLGLVARRRLRVADPEPEAE